jgi:hypothetical protein
MRVPHTPLFRCQQQIRYSFIAGRQCAGHLGVFIVGRQSAGHLAVFIAGHIGVFIHRRPSTGHIWFKFVRDWRLSTQPH